MILLAMHFVTIHCPLSSTVTTAQRYRIGDELIFLYVRSRLVFCTFSITRHIHILYENERQYCQHLNQTNIDGKKIENKVRTNNYILRAMHLLTFYFSLPPFTTVATAEL